MKDQQTEPPTIESYLTKLAEQLTGVVITLREQIDQLKDEIEEQREFIRSMKQNERSPDSMLTVREAAKIAGVSYETMIAWVNWENIEAVNVAKKRGGRPTWRIAPTELQRFLKSRARFRYEPPKRRKRRSSSGVIDRY